MSSSTTSSAAAPPPAAASAGGGAAADGENKNVEVGNDSKNVGSNKLSEETGGGGGSDDRKGGAAAASDQKKKADDDFGNGSSNENNGSPAAQQQQQERRNSEGSSFLYCDEDMPAYYDATLFNRLVPTRQVHRPSSEGHRHPASASAAAAAKDGARAVAATGRKTSAGSVAVGKKNKGRLEDKKSAGGVAGKKKTKKKDLAEAVKNQKKRAGGSNAEARSKDGKRKKLKTAAGSSSKGGKGGKNDEGDVADYYTNRNSTVAFPHLNLAPDWSDLRLGSGAVGSAAWNDRLEGNFRNRERLGLVAVSSDGGGVAAVPALSAADCLDVVRERVRLRTVLPPPGSSLHAALKTYKWQDEQKHKKQKQTKPKNNPKLREKGRPAASAGGVGTKNGGGASTGKEIDTKAGAATKNAAGNGAAANVAAIDSKNDNADLEQLGEEIAQLYRGMVADEVGGYRDYYYRSLTSAQVLDKVDEISNRAADLKRRENYQRMLLGERSFQDGRAAGSDAELLEKINALRGIVVRDDDDIEDNSGISSGGRRSKQIFWQDDFDSLLRNRGPDAACLHRHDAW